AILPAVPGRVVRRLRLVASAPGREKGCQRQACRSDRRIRGASGPDEEARDADQEGPAAWLWALERRRRFRVLPDRSGVLAGRGKIAVTIAPSLCSFALDGPLAAW